MKSFRLVALFSLCLFLVLGTRNTRAQALPTAKGPGPYLAVGVGGSYFATDYGKLHLAAPTVWVDANIHRYVGLEAEARLLRYGNDNGTGVKQDTYLVGPRIAFKPSHWVPYVKMPVGIGKMDFPYGFAKGTYFVMAPGAGVDYWLRDGIRVRLVDFEYQVWPQFTYGTIHPYGVTAGISFRVF